MKLPKLLLVACTSFVFSSSLLAAEKEFEDAIWFSSASFLELDWDDTKQGDNYTLDGQWLYGSDYNKLAVIATAEQEDNLTTSAEVQLLYSRYLTGFWDARIGVRHEFQPESESSIVVGVEGLAPYWFEVGFSLYMSEESDLSGELELAYDLQLTQKLILQLYSNSEYNGYSDKETNTGSGLANGDYGYQLRYEFNRHIAPYIEFNKAQAYGDTKDYLSANGEDTSQSGWRLGIRIFNF